MNRSYRVKDKGLMDRQHTVPYKRGYFESDRFLMKVSHNFQRSLTPCPLPKIFIVEEIFVVRWPNH